jgi:hypothetical protein
MGKRIQIEVKNKIARKTCDTVYICGNSDYVVDFAFDAEWDAYPVKTARFVPGNSQPPIDVVFEGRSCEVPVISDTMQFKAGVYAGDLHTTTPATVPAKKSILCGSGTPSAPPENVYAQIMDRLNSMSGGYVSPDAIENAVNAYMQEHPVDGVTKEELAQTVNQFSQQKADKEYMVALFNELKALILAGDTAAAVAVLDQAILDNTILA